MKLVNREMEAARLERTASSGTKELVVLFGSYAKGRRDLLTDLDVLVVMHSDKPFVDRIAELYRELHVPVDMDLVCYTPGEFEDMRDSPFVKRALSEGVVLYAKGSAGGREAVD